MPAVTIRYAGAPICTDAQVLESSDSVIVVTTAEPMPVGTELDVIADDRSLRVRVAGCREGAPGQMRLTVGESDRKKKRGRKRSA